MTVLEIRRTWLLVVVALVLCHLPSPGAAWVTASLASTATATSSLSTRRGSPLTNLWLKTTTFQKQATIIRHSSFSQSLHLFRAGSDSESESEDSESSSDDAEEESDFKSTFQQEIKQAEADALAAEATKSRMQTALLNSGVGGIVLWGGITGFMTKGSKASLIAGSVFGGLMLFAAKKIFQNKNGSAASGFKLASVLSGVLTVIMGRRYFKTGVYMPTGMIATLCIIAFFYNIVDTMVEASEKP